MRGVVIGIASASAAALVACSLLISGDGYVGNAADGSAARDGASSSTSGGASSSGGGDTGFETDAKADAAAEPCSFADAGADFCDDFDRGAALARWQPPAYRGVDAGVTLGTTASKSPPAHLRIALPSTTYDTVVPSARVDAIVPSPFVGVGLSFDYRLTAYAIPNGSQSSHAAIVALQRRGAGGDSALARLELTATNAGSQPQMILRIFDAAGTTELHAVTLPSPTVALDEWHHYEMRVEPGVGDAMFVSLWRDGTEWLARKSYTMPVVSGESWSLRVGGFASAIPKTIAAITQDYDNVVVHVD